MSGEWVNIRVVSNMGKDGYDLRPLAGRRQAGGRTGSRGGYRGRTREKAKGRRDGGGRGRSRRWKDRTR